MFARRGGTSPDGSPVFCGEACEALGKPPLRNEPICAYVIGHVAVTLMGPERELRLQSRVRQGGLPWTRAQTPGQRLRPPPPQHLQYGIVAYESTSLFHCTAITAC